MKSIKDIRHLLESLAEETDNTEVRKLTALVKSGLFDAHKISLLKRALSKENARMSKTERDALLELLDKLLSVVLSNQSVYSKIKQNVAEENDYIDIPLDESASELDSKNDDKSKSSGKYSTKTLTNIDITQVPPIIVMKRKSIRIFPGGEKVALYWADRINKYISVPFQSIGISEEVMQNINEIAANQANKLRTLERSARAAEIRAKRTGEVSHMQNAVSARKAVDDHIQSMSNSNFNGPASQRKKRISQYQNILNKSIDNKSSKKKMSTKKVLDAYKEKKTKEYGEKQKEFEKTSANRGKNVGSDAGSLYKKAGGGLKGTGAALGGAIGMAIHRKMNKVPTAPVKPSFMKENINSDSKFKMKLEELRKNNIDEGALQTADDFMRATGDMLGGKYVAAAGDYAVKKLIGRDTTYAKELEQEKEKSEKASKRSPKATTAGHIAGTGLALAGGAKIAKAALGTAGSVAAGLAAGSAAGGDGGSSKGSGSSGDYQYDVKRGKAFDGAAPIRGIKPKEDKKDSESTQEIRDRQSYRKSMKENVLNNLKNIDENVIIEYTDGNVEITPAIANMIIETYNALNYENKKVVREMINKNKSNFVKFANFAANKV